MKNECWSRFPKITSSWFGFIPTAGGTLTGGAGVRSAARCGRAAGGALRPKRLLPGSLPLPLPTPEASPLFRSLTH